MICVTMTREDDEDPLAHRPVTFWQELKSSRSSTNNARRLSRRTEDRAALELKYQAIYKLFVRRTRRYCICGEQDEEIA
jgi:hypothetical protein